MSSLIGLGQKSAEKSIIDYATALLVQQRDRV